MYFDQLINSVIKLQLRLFYEKKANVPTIFETAPKIYIHTTGTSSMREKTSYILYMKKQKKKLRKRGKRRINSFPICRKLHKLV